jgi:membrane protease YdiL (CAAX protease family)
MIDSTALPEPPPRKEVWGGWATAGFGLVVIIIFIIVQSLVAVAFIVNKIVANPELDIVGLADKLVSDGNLITAATIASALVCGALILVIIKVRHGAKLAGYLAFKSISFRSVLIMLAITIVFILLTSGIGILLKRPVDSDFITTAYESVTPLPLFWIAIVIIAPLFEEMFIRGFLFIGFVRSSLGPVGAVLLTALVWAGLHIQYGLYEIGVIFALGIVLGIVRYRTGSLWCSVIIHSLNNLLAVFVVYLSVNGIIN